MNYIAFEQESTTASLDVITINTEETTVTDSTTEPIACGSDADTKCLVWTTEVPSTTTSVVEGESVSFAISQLYNKVMRFNQSFFKK